MAKQGKILPARRPREAFEDSSLIRSAETLGRVIGSLHRQLDNASRRFADREDDLDESVTFSDNGARATGNGAGTKKVRKTTAKTASTRKASAKATNKASAAGGSRRKSAADRARR